MGDGEQRWLLESGAALLLHNVIRRAVAGGSRDPVGEMCRWLVDGPVELSPEELEAFVASVSDHALLLEIVSESSPATLDPNRAAHHACHLKVCTLLADLPEIPLPGFKPEKALSADTVAKDPAAQKPPAPASPPPSLLSFAGCLRSGRAALRRVLRRLGDAPLVVFALPLSSLVRAGLIRALAGLLDELRWCFGGEAGFQVKVLDDLQGDGSTAARSAIAVEGGGALVDVVDGTVSGALRGLDAGWDGEFCLVLMDGSRGLPVAQVGHLLEKLLEVDSTVGVLCIDQSPMPDGEQPAPGEWAVAVGLAMAFCAPSRFFFDKIAPPPHPAATPRNEGFWWTRASAYRGSALRALHDAAPFGCRANHALELSCRIASAAARQSALVTRKPVPILAAPLPFLPPLAACAGCGPDLSFEEWQAFAQSVLPDALAAGRKDAAIYKANTACHDRDLFAGLLADVRLRHPAGPLQRQKSGWTK
ncbi:hypothetical protein DIPPA_23038 [Diplonema papillatum]|nr:hypothetical protein DIPPA_23038 [Diplonema papillatum]